MRVRILGTHGNIEASAPSHVKHSGILIDARLLLGIGEIVSASNPSVISFKKEIVGAGFTPAFNYQNNSYLYLNVCIKPAPTISFFLYFSWRFGVYDWI